MQRNGITAIRGIRVGHWSDQSAKTGCTVVLCPDGGAVGGVDVRGAAPGTRETDLLQGYHAVDRVHAILLTGGSAYGLDAAGGVMQYLEERGIGIDVGVGVVPIVPAAVLFDLACGSPAVRPGKAQGYAACAAASENGALRGRVGAGTGATVGKAFGMEAAAPGGLGSACVEIGGGVFVAALAAVNALGDVYDHQTGALLASATIENKPMLFEHAAKAAQFAGANTTLGVIATNAALTREEANKLACMAQDGYAMSIRPVHTNMDGDTVFAISTMETPPPSLLALFAAGAQVMAAAIENAFIDRTR